MSESFTIDRVIPAPPERVYEAWLQADLHAQMTGTDATSEPRAGGAFTAWDGYIEGTHLELEPGKRIVQSWRTMDFPDDAPDSRLEITLVASGGGTLLTLAHSDLPDGSGDDYRTGWEDHYFQPMTGYFNDTY